MGENKCQGCPNYKKNEYTGWMQCYGDKCETEIRADERRKFCQMVKDNNGLIGGKDGMVVTTQEDFEDILAETESNAIRKFAEWLINRMHRNSLQRVLSETKNFDIMGIDNILSIYEKEQKEGAE